MKQWSMRISAYSDRLLQGLDKIDWPEPLKDMQKNWIGKSKGAIIRFKVYNKNEHIEKMKSIPDYNYPSDHFMQATDIEIK